MRQVCHHKRTYVRQHYCFVNSSSFHLPSLENVIRKMSDSVLVVQQSTEHMGIEYAAPAVTMMNSTVPSTLERVSETQA